PGSAWSVYGGEPEHALIQVGAPHPAGRAIIVGPAVRRLDKSGHRQHRQHRSERAKRAAS
ncbi:hypothetical protein, partial [Mycobacterium tuberculosis]|uniref:hypothetical protein n=1 Tax=Mycobacterium tuberculosis TaxID=1773 RepID=UPI0019D4E36D